MEALRKRAKPMSSRVAGRVGNYKAQQPSSSYPGNHSFMFTSVPISIEQRDVALFAKWYLIKFIT